MRCKESFGPKGIPMATVEGSPKQHDLLPLIWLVDRHCKINEDFSVLTSPQGREIAVTIVNSLPYIDGRHVEELLADLPEADTTGRYGMTASYVAQTAFTQLRASVAATENSGKVFQKLLFHLQEIRGGTLCSTVTMTTYRHQNHTSTQET